MKGSHLPFCTAVQTFEHKGGWTTKHAETLYKPQIHPLHNIKYPQSFHETILLNIHLSAWHTILSHDFYLAQVKS